MSAHRCRSRAEREQVRAQRRAEAARRTDAVALIFGLLATGLAACVLWWAIVGPIDTDVIKIGAPTLLVVAGILGLALSRSRSS